MAAATDGPIGVWLPGPPMTEHPDYHSALLLQDGRVMILASRAEVYDPAGKRWSMAGTPMIMRSSQGATVLRDGRVLVTGGIDSLLDEFWSPAALSASRPSQPVFGAFPSRFPLVPMTGCRESVSLISTPSRRFPRTS